MKRPSIAASKAAPAVISEVPGSKGRPEPSELELLIRTQLAFRETRRLCRETLAILDESRGAR